MVAFGLFSALSSLLLWYVIGLFYGGIRVSESEEVEGLDIGEHGMEAYPDFASTR